MNQALDNPGLSRRRLLATAFAVTALGLIALLAEQEHRKRAPLTTVDGQFSIYFCVAVALRLGRLAWDDYATQLFDPEVRSLIDRTRVYHDERAVQGRNGSAAGSVRVITRHGDIFERVVNLPKGEPENMLTTTELRAKFDSLVGPYLGADGGAELFDDVLRLDAAPSIDVLFNSAARCVQ